MNRISRTVVAGCTVGAIAAAIGAASARADSFSSSELAYAKDGGVAVELAAKDAGRLDLSAKDGGIEFASAKDGGIEFASAKDGGAAALAAY